MRFRRPVAIAVVALATTACIDTLAVPDARYGVMSIATYGTSPQAAVMTPEVIFYDKTDLRFTVPAADSCFVTAYSPTGTVDTRSFTLDAGDFLVQRIGSRVDTLSQFFAGNLVVYRPPSGRLIPFVPGDTLSIQVPGAPGGFPAVTANVRTAEAFTHDSVVTTPTGQPMALRWTTPPVAGSLMTFTLRYANPFSLDAQPNEQIFCAFTDDGTGAIPDDYLSSWRQAPEASRSVRAVRLRSKEIVIDSRTRFVMVSTYGLPLYSAPQ
jgi:hypothetical protein